MNVERRFAQVRAAAKLRALLELQQRRDRLFPSHIFSNPAWDILLKLYSAALNEQQAHLSDLCNQQLPTSVTLRWLDALSAEGLVVVNESSEGTITFVLSAAGWHRMKTLIEE